MSHGGGQESHVHKCFRHLADEEVVIVLVDILEDEHGCGCGAANRGRLATDLYPVVEAGAHDLASGTRLLALVLVALTKGLPTTRPELERRQHGEPRRSHCQPHQQDGVVDDDAELLDGGVVDVNEKGLWLARRAWPARDKTTLEWMSPLAGRSCRGAQRRHDTTTL